MDKVILAMYSGGLDSLGMIYHLLTDPAYKDYKLHVHHVHNKNIENRHKAEAITVRAATEELKRLGFAFDYSESEIGTQPYGKQFMYDTDTISFLAGYICLANPAIVNVAIGMNANDENYSLNERKERADKLLAAFTPVKKIYPMLNKSKREIYDSLPDTLKNMFWSCRHPVYTETSISPCGRCKTCHQLRVQGIR